MNGFRLILAGFGVPEKCLSDEELKLFKIMREGEIWRPRTGELYQENIIQYEIEIPYAKGCEFAFKELIDFIESNSLKTILGNCRSLQVQVCLEIDDEMQIPHISMTPNQMQYFGSLNANLDVHLSSF